MCVYIYVGIFTARVTDRVIFIYTRTIYHSLYTDAPTAYYYIPDYVRTCGAVDTDLRVRWDLDDIITHRLSTDDDGDEV